MKQNNYNGVLQQQVPSMFGATSTTTDVMKGIDLTGKVAIVTGGNAGIGLETTKVLAAAGARVIVGARDLEKAQRQLNNVENVVIERLDLMDPGSIDHFAEIFLTTGRTLDILVNNAGIMWVPLRRDRRGIESQLATNYLGQYHLTGRLFPALMAAGGARVVNLSSQGHQFGDIDFDDLNFHGRTYDTLTGYGQSKTACNLYTMELDNRARKWGIRSYAVHPGSIAGTELAREAPIELLRQMGFFDEQGNIRPEIAAGLKTVPQGAATTVWCATSSELDGIGGVYCEDVNVALVADRNGESAQGGVKLYSLDEAKAKKLWKWSEEMTGIVYPVEG